MLLSFQVFHWLIRILNRALHPWETSKGISTEDTSSIYQYQQDTGQYIAWPALPGHPLDKSRGSGNFNKINYYHNPKSPFSSWRTTLFKLLLFSSMLPIIGLYLLFLLSSPYKMERRNKSGYKRKSKNILDSINCKQMGKGSKGWISRTK